MSTRPLAVLRPEPGNSATAAAARTLGLTVYAVPLFEMAPRAWAPPAAQHYAAILAGSANVFRLGGDGLASLRAMPVHAVGAVTADAARTAGFSVAVVGEGGLQPMASALQPGRYLRLAGEKRVPLLLPEGVTVDDVVVYCAQPLPLPAELAERLHWGAVVLLHSAEAARYFARECSRMDLSRAALALACLAPRIAEAAGRGWQSVEIAGERTDQALLALAAQMCQNV